MENFENFEIHRVGSNILPSCTKRDLGCHGSTPCGQNLMKMEEISRHHPLTTLRTILKPIGLRERELSSLIPSTDPIRIKIEEGCWPLLWEFLSAGMVAMVSNRGNFSTRTIGSLVRIR